MRSLLPRRLAAALGAALLGALLLLLALLARTAVPGAYSGGAALLSRRPAFAGGALAPAASPPLWAACGGTKLGARRRAPPPWPPSAAATLLTAASVSASWGPRASRLVRANCAEFAAYVPDGRMVLPPPPAAAPAVAAGGAAADAGGELEPPPVVVLAWANPELLMHMAEFFASLEAGAWERATLLALRALLEREGGAHGDFSCVDFGAWIGPTVLFAANFAPRVLALEPHPRAAAILAANLALPANTALAARVRIFRECIAREAGTMTLVGDGDSSNRLAAASLAGRAAESVEVSCRTLPQFVLEERASNLRVIKMDVEGAELEILPSLAPWLRALDAAAVEAELAGTEAHHRGKPSIVLSLHAPFWAAPTDAQLVAVWEVLALFRFVYEGAALRDRSAGFRGGGVTVEADRLHAMRILSNFTELVLTDEELPPELLALLRP